MSIHNYKIQVGSVGSTSALWELSLLALLAILLLQMGVQIPDHQRSFPANTSLVLLFFHLFLSLFRGTGKVEILFLAENKNFSIQDLMRGILDSFAGWSLLTSSVSETAIINIHMQLCKWTGKCYWRRVWLERPTVFSVCHWGEKREEDFYNGTAATWREQKNRK